MTSFSPRSVLESLLQKEQKLCVVGLGYVGLPLVAAFSPKVSVVGYDIDKEKVKRLVLGLDPNNELPPNSFDPNEVHFTSNLNDISDCRVYIVTVPTPITKNNTPDLEPLKSASQSIASVIKKGDVIIYESTVFPGCTEEICIPILEELSGLTSSIDFFVGYSPERINPGDKMHTLSNTIKIVSGQNEKTSDFVSLLYEQVITVGVHRSSSIKVAEAAKIIENVQRDLNIALMNELALIFDKMNINTQDVIEAAGTKWNFHKYYPGLVGGHCISVDPYYLTYKAQEMGYTPDVILSGRKVNDEISSVITKKVLQCLSTLKITPSEARVLVMGVTFKENVSDIRNSRVLDLINELMSYGIKIDAFDPYANKEVFKRTMRFELADQPSGTYDCIITAVGHASFMSWDEKSFINILKPSSKLIDVKAIYRNKFKTIKSWSL